MRRRHHRRLTELSGRRTWTRAPRAKWQAYWGGEGSSPAIFQGRSSSDLSTMGRSHSRPTGQRTVRGPRMQAELRPALDRRQQTSERSSPTIDTGWSTSATRGDLYAFERRMTISSGPPVAAGGPSPRPRPSQRGRYVVVRIRPPTVLPRRSVRVRATVDLTLDRSHQSSDDDRCVADRCRRDGLRRIGPPRVHVTLP